MHKLILKYLIVLMPMPLMAQYNLYKELPQLDGIWVAKDFHSSFSVTKSIVSSKNSFNQNYPVALRINHNEMVDSVLNIGYGFLDSHMLYPEVQYFETLNQDTLFAAGNLKIDLKQFPISNCYRTSHINYFSESGITLLRYDFTIDTALYLIQYDTVSFEFTIIIYQKVTNHIFEKYPYPNPLYYYLRMMILEGNYTLSDGSNNLLSDNFNIFRDGKCSGYLLLNNKHVYYSTDIYCGPPALNDLVLFCNPLFEKDNLCENYYITIKENVIFLYEPIYNDEATKSEEQLGALKYILRKNK